jgi:hypothetical protein
MAQAMKLVVGRWSSAFGQKLNGRRPKADDYNNSFPRSWRGSQPCTIYCADHIYVENPLKMRPRRFSFIAGLYMMWTVFSGTGTHISRCVKEESWQV